MLIEPGTMLTPNLRLLRLLGRGGMGSVWLAEHLGLGSEVAVKLLSSELANDEEALERFRREATAVARLKSPHVVAIHDFGATSEGVPFFVMERLVGEDLSQRLDRVEQLPVGIVTAIISQICKALARAHELGVVHRDLKPGNIFLTTVDGDLVVKLLDFGVAKMREGAAAPLLETSEQAMLGTPMYMSPEQILSPKAVGPASDLYSLAVVIYECLAGRRPFDGETAGAVHVGIVNGRYTKISEIDPSLPVTLDAWFARALASDPEKRFTSAREMADAFLAASRSQFALDRSPVDEPMLLGPSFLTVAAPTTLRLPRRPTPPTSIAPLLAGVLVVLVLIGGIFGATRLGRHSSSSPIVSVHQEPTAQEEQEPTPSVEAIATTTAPTEPAPTSEPADAPTLSHEASPSLSASVRVSDDAPSASQAPPTSAVVPAHAKAPRRKNRGF